MQKNIVLGALLLASSSIIQPSTTFTFEPRSPNALAGSAAQSSSMPSPATTARTWSVASELLSPDEATKSPNNSNVQPIAHSPFDEHDDTKFLYPAPGTNALRKLQALLTQSRIRNTLELLEENTRKDIINAEEIDSDNLMQEQYIEQEVIHRTQARAQQQAIAVQEQQHVQQALAQQQATATQEQQNQWAAINYTHGYFSDEDDGEKFYTLKFPLTSAILQDLMARGTQLGYFVNGTFYPHDAQRLLASLQRLEYQETMKNWHHARLAALAAGKFDEVDRLLDNKPDENI